MLPCLHGLRERHEVVRFAIGTFHSPGGPELFEPTVDVPVPQWLRSGRNSPLRSLKSLNVAARRSGQAHLLIRISCCRFVHCYLTRYRVPALTLNWGSKEYAFQAARLTSGGRDRLGAAIPYEMQDEICAAHSGNPLLRSGGQVEPIDSMSRKGTR